MIYLPDRSLRSIIGVDAVTCAAMAAVLLVGADTLSSFLAIPRSLLLVAAAILFPISGFMGYVATRPAVPRWAAWAVIFGNVGWVIASVALVLGSLIAPTPLGIGFILAQAAVVAILAAAEHRALMRQVPLRTSRA